MMSVIRKKDTIEVLCQVSKDSRDSQRTVSHPAKTES